MIDASKRVRFAAWAILPMAVIGSAATATGEVAVPPGQAEAAVTLTAEIDDCPIYGATGIVFSADDRQAYIAVDAYRTLSWSKRGEAIVSYRVAFGERKVTVRKVAELESGARLIFAGPKEELPSPLPTKAAATIQVGASLLLVGTETRFNDEFQYVYRRTAVPIRVAQLYRNPTTLETTISLVTDESVAIGRGLLVTQEGQVVATAVPDLKQPRSTKGYRGYLGKPLSEFAGVGTAETVDVRMNVFTTGDRGRTQMVLRAVDPLARMKKARLLVTILPVPAGERPLNGLQRVWPHESPITIREGAWVDKPADSQEIDLVPRWTIDPLIDLRTNLEALPDANIWGGVCEFPMPGAVQFSCLFVEMSDQGRYRPLGKAQCFWIAKGIERFGVCCTADEREKSPYSLITDRAPSHPQGGTWVSSRALPTDDLRPPILSIASEPEAASEPLLGEIDAKGGLATAPLNISHLENQAAGNRKASASMASSADGRTLFVVDGRDVVHKIDTATWTCKARRNIGFPCTDASAAGNLLLLSAPSWQAVFALDADTLQTKHIFTAPFLVTAVGSAGSPFVVVIRTTRWEVYDGRTGKRVTTVPFELLIAGGMSHDDLKSPSAAMSDDGRYLFVGTRAVGRFRIDDGDLVLEEVSARREISNGGRIVVTGEGKWVLPSFNDPIVRDRLGLQVLSGLRLADPPRFVEVANIAPGVAVIGPEAEYVFSASIDGAISVHEIESGKQLHQGRLQSSAKPLRILALPGGDRVVVWGDRLTVVDMRPDRLQNASK